MFKKCKILNKTILLLILILAFLLSIPFYVKYKSRGKIFTNVENIASKDFALVLGAGIKPDGTPGPYLRKRLDDAYFLYENNKIKKILLTGDNGYNQHDEISVMNNYLISKGVPQNIIFADYAGFDTYSSMERADKIFGITNAIIVSQNYHLPRSLYIAENKGIDAVCFSSNSSYGRKIFKVREWFATVKAVIDCLRNRKAKFYGDKVDTNGNSNVELKQL